MVYNHLTIRRGHALGVTKRNRLVINSDTEQDLFADSLQYAEHDDDFVGSNGVHLNQQEQEAMLVMNDYWTLLDDNYPEE